MHAVIDSGMYTMGKHVSAFERDFASFVGARHCVMVNSGSSANLLMVAALRYRKISPLLPGAEVIVPAVSWSTTYFPLHQYGLRLKFVDIDRETLNFDLNQLKDAISGETRAIMAVNLLGNPNDFGTIRDLIAGRDIILLEDNCEAMGATFEGRQTGTFGVMGSFSAFFSHHISTMEGGMVVTDDEELYQILLCLRAHGWTRNLPDENLVCGRKRDNPFEELFRFVLPGYNLRPLELSGAIGVAQLRKLPAMILERRRNAERFNELISSFKNFSPQREIGTSSWFGFSLIVAREAPFARADVVAAFARRGIEARPIVAGNFAKNEALRWIDYTVHGTLRHAEEIDRAGLFIGNHHYPLDNELKILQEALDSLSPASLTGTRV